MNEDEKLVWKVRELLIRDNTELALELLLDYAEAKSKEYKLLVAYSASLERVRSCFYSSLIPYDTFHSEVTKVILGVLDIMETVFLKRKHELDSYTDRPIIASGGAVITGQNNIDLDLSNGNKPSPNSHSNPVNEPQAPYPQKSLDELLGEQFSNMSDKLENYIQQYKDKLYK